MPIANAQDETTRRPQTCYVIISNSIRTRFFFAFVCGIVENTKIRSLEHRQGLQMKKALVELETVAQACFVNTNAQNLDLQCWVIFVAIRDLI